MRLEWLPCYWWLGNAQNGVSWWWFLKISMMQVSLTLQWRHNERDGVSKHRRLDCLPNLLFGHGSKKTSKHQSSASLAFVRGIHRWPVNSPGPVITVARYRYTTHFYSVWPSSFSFHIIKEVSEQGQPGGPRLPLMSAFCPPTQCLKSKPFF